MKPSESLQVMLDRIDGALSSGGYVVSAVPWVRMSDGYDILLGPLIGVGVVCHLCQLVEGGGMYIGLKPSDVSAHAKRHEREGHDLPPTVYRMIAERWRFDVLGR